MHSEKRNKTGNQCISNKFFDWKFGTVNIRSGKQKDEGAKIYSIAKTINNTKLIFCCIQEVKYRNSGHKVIKLDTGDEYEFHWCGAKKRREAGVGILIKVDKRIEVQNPDYEDPRIMAINLKIYGFCLRVVNAYAPTETGGSKSEKDTFYRNLSKACNIKERNRKLLVLGDLNATTSLAYRKSCFDGVKVLPDDNFNENGSKLKSFCRKMKLGMASTFFDYPMNERVTWYSCDKKTTKKNDFVLPESFIQQYISSCKAYPDIDFDSDHKILITSLSTPTCKRARWKQKLTLNKGKVDALSLRDITTKNKFVDEVKREITNTKKHGANTDVISSETISDFITKTLKAVGETTLPSKNPKKGTNEIWKNDKEFNDLLNCRKNHRVDTDEYKQTTKKLKKRIKFLRNKKLADEANEINEHANRRDIENLYKCMKSSDDAFDDIKRRKKCDPNILKNHFVKHFNPTCSKPDPPELNEAPHFIKELRHIYENNLKTSPPDTDELRKTIIKLKSGKSANDVPTIYVKAAIECEGFIEEMVKLYKTIWETNSIPVDWGHSRLVAIWKGAAKGSIENPEAYRALQIGSSLCKILVITIINRIKIWYDKQLLDQQLGFRSGRGTTDGLYRIKRVQQIARRRKNQIFAIFVDLTAAFDHVNRKWLFKSIKQRFKANSDMKLVELLETLYQHTSTSLAETPDDRFETSTGVRQGGPESPLLYNLYMDYVMRVFIEECKEKHINFVKHKYRIPDYACDTNIETLGINLVDWIGYADDIVLCFETRDLLQKAVDVLSDTFKRFNLNINVSKTKTMIINNNDALNEYPTSICSLEDKRIDNVKVFRYLGGNIKYNEQNTGDEEVELRLESGEAKFYALSKKFFNHKIPLRTRAQILNTLIRSRLTYACQCWSITEKQKQLLCSKYNLMLRKMTKGGFHRKDNSMSFKYTNADILRLCKSECLDKFIEKQQKKYLAHLIRMGNNSTSKKLLFDDTPSRNPGPEITLFSSVLKSENISAKEFAKKALAKNF